MLNCIIGMVDKTKRALAVLQERSLRDREELSLWMRRQAEGMDQDLKKRSSDMMSHTIRQTEDRVTDVRRRAGMFVPHCHKLNFWILEEIDNNTVNISKMETKKLS